MGIVMPTSQGYSEDQMTIAAKVTLISLKIKSIYIYISEMLRTAPGTQAFSINTRYDIFISVPI